MPNRKTTDPGAPNAPGSFVRLAPHEVAKMLGGEARGNGVLAPGPGHSPRDRSMSILVDRQAPEGFVVTSFAGDDPLQCRDHVRELLGLPAWRATRPVEMNVNQPKFKATYARFPDAASALAIRVFGEALPLHGTVGAEYLIRRAGNCLTWPDDLRFHPECARRTGNGIERRPAVVALMRDIRTNEPRAIQRIFIQPDGSDRLRDPMGKATLGPAKGAVVKLTVDEDVTIGLGITEGVETGLALIARGWSPIWATAGTSGMAAFPVLNGIDALTVFADNDENGAGDTAAAKAIVRWREAGREARGRKPRLPGHDWADVSRRAA